MSVIGWAMVTRGRGRGTRCCTQLLTLGWPHALRFTLAFRASSVRWLKKRTSIFFKGISFINWSDLMKKSPPTYLDFEQKFQNFRLAYHRKGLLPMGILNQNSAQGFILH